MITQSDFITPITGNVVIDSDLIRLTVQANADQNTGFEGNERFRIIFRKDSNTGPIVLTTSNILLADTSNTKQYVSLTYNISSNVLPENSNIVFHLNTINVSTANVLYYYTTGNVSNSSFLQGNTGTFTVNAAGNASIVLTSADITANTAQFFQLNISETSLGSPVITSNTITLLDNNLVYIQASGGTVVTSGGFRTHIFTSTANLSISSLGMPGTTIDYVVVAGGGGAGPASGIPTFGPGAPGGGGGGGAGGYRSGTIPNDSLSATSYVMTIGSGGTAQGPGYTAAPTPGNPSSAFGIVSAGGGKGQGFRPFPLGATAGIAQSGGSGGGGNYYGGNGSVAGGAGNTPPVSPPQGNPGGTGGSYTAAGGGGAGSAGSIFSGGVGRVNPISPPSYGTTGPTPGRWFAGGGSAGPRGSPPLPSITGGAGGGGNGGGVVAPNAGNPGTAGVVNTGGGGGGGGGGLGTIGISQSGGSGIIMIRYPYQ